MLKWSIFELKSTQGGSRDLEIIHLNLDPIEAKIVAVIPHVSPLIVKNVLWSNTFLAAGSLHSPSIRTLSIESRSPPSPLCIYCQPLQRHPFSLSFYRKKFLYLLLSALLFQSLPLFPLFPRRLQSLHNFLLQFLRSFPSLCCLLFNLRCLHLQFQHHLHH